MSKNVAVFVDVANIFYAAKAAGVDIDYVTLLRAATAGRDFVRAYAYTGLDPENENQRNFHAFLQRHGYRVVSKDIRKYGDGKVKANLDIELVVDMLKTSRNLDIAVLVSGDGDFAPAIRAVQEMGVRVEVISFRGNTSSDLIEVADQFIDITQIAKVEKGSTRSGRRIAATADEDLSMTEVPEKQTEGTGRGRGRGRRARTAEEAPEVALTVGETAAGEVLVAAPAGSASGRRRRAPAAPALTLLPGEKLSGRVAGVGAAEPTVEPTLEADGEARAEAAPESAETLVEVGALPAEGGEGAARRRRRRRRGGRGRGRGRAEATEAGELEELGPEEAVELEPLPTPSPVRHSTFGSVWDSQIGMPSAPRTDLPLPPEEDLEEPEVPEYLLAERRRRAQGNRVRGGRAGRAYAAAVERERFGRPGTSGVTRYPETARPAGHGVGGGRPTRPERPAERRERPSAEPWSEVPPEIEAMLRAQLAAKKTGGAPTADRDRGEPEQLRAEAGAAPAETAEAVATAPTEAAPKRRGRRRTTADVGEASASQAEAPSTTGAGPEAAEEAAAAVPTRRRTTRRRAEAAAEGPAAETAVPSGEATAATAQSGASRRGRRRTAPTPAESGEGDAEAAAAAPPSTARRRTTRRRAAEVEAGGAPDGEAPSSPASTDA